MSLNGTTPDFIPEHFRHADGNRAGHTAQSVIHAEERQRRPDPESAVGPRRQHHGATRRARAEARGTVLPRPHDATATFDIGNPNLKIEVAKSVEVGLRRAKGPLRFEATAYYTRFDGFIFRRLTGDDVRREFRQLRRPGDRRAQPGGLFPARRDLPRRRIPGQWDTLPMWNGVWGVEGQFDMVRATFTDGTNVPRIPPLRVGGGVFYRDGDWLARVSLLHAFAQNDIASAARRRPPATICSRPRSATRGS